MKNIIILIITFLVVLIVITILINKHQMTVKEKIFMNRDFGRVIYDDKPAVGSEPLTQVTTGQNNHIVVGSDSLENLKQSKPVTDKPVIYKLKVENVELY